MLNKFKADLHIILCYIVFIYLLMLVKFLHRVEKATLSKYTMYSLLIPDNNPTLHAWFVKLATASFSGFDPRGIKISYCLVPMFPGCLEPRSKPVNKSWSVGSMDHLFPPAFEWYDPAPPGYPWPTLSLPPVANDQVSILIYANMNSLRYSDDTQLSDRRDNGFV